MAQCITCGTELHPDRAAKYNYCMAPDCQRKNLKGLDMVAVGVNKAAEQYLLLDDKTRDDLARGRFADQRRGSFGTSLPAPGQPVKPSHTPAPIPPGPRSPKPAAPRPAAPEPRKPWTRSQEKLALLYNEQGQRPEQIARKLNLSRYLVTQIILSSRNRGKV
jgi:hypothetical protein